MSKIKVPKSWILLVLSIIALSSPVNALTNDIVVYNETFEHLLFNNQTNLTIPTYDGSYQSTHPDVISFATAWNGYKYWMAFTPYPNATNAYENPSVVVSNDGLSWIVPVGLTNPITPDPAATTNNGYNSDTDLVYNDAANQLYLYYIQDNFTPSPATNELKLKTSADGVTWGDEQTLFTMKHNYIVSPAIIKNGSSWYLWYVNSTDSGSAATSTTIEYRTSSNGIAWSNASTVNLSAPVPYVPWHINVNYNSTSNQYMMLITAGVNIATTSDVLLLSTSSNGINWTTSPGKLMGLGDNADFDKSSLYRSTMTISNNDVQLWYSAINTTGVYTNWSIGYVTDTLTNLLNPYHWEWRTPTSSDGTFNLTTEQIHSGNTAVKLEYKASGTDVIYNITSPYNSSGYNTSFKVWMYDDGDLTAMKQLRIRNNSINTGVAIKQISFGVWTDQSNSVYTYSSGVYKNTAITRTVGWHELRVDVWNDKTVDYYIDGDNVATETNVFNDPVQIVFPTLSYTTINYFDDLKFVYNNSANDTMLYVNNIINVVDSSGHVRYNRERTTAEIPKNISVVPSSDLVNVTIDSWNINGTKTWTETSATHSITTSHTVGDFPANTIVYLITDGDASKFQVYVTNSTGWASFDYTGGFSSHAFLLDTSVPDTTHSSIITSCNSAISWANIGFSVLVIVLLAAGGGMALMMLITRTFDGGMIIRYVLGIVLIVIIGVLGLAIANPIVNLVGC